MPKLLAKRAVLNGIAEVLAYERDPQAWFLRAYNKSQRSYRSLRIEGAFDIITAVERSQETLERLLSPDGGRTTRKGVERRRDDLEDLSRRFLKHEWELVQSGSLSVRTFDKKSITMRVGVMPYLESERLVFPHQLSFSSFSSYPVFRRDSVKSKLTLNGELATISSFLNFVRREGFDLPKIDLKHRRITSTDLDANPAINREDWETIKSFVKGQFKQERLDRSIRKNDYYFCDLFYEFILFLYNTGGRPEEIIKLRWKDLSIETLERFSETELDRRIKAEGIDPSSLTNKEKQTLGRVSYEVVSIRLVSSKTGETRFVSAPIVPSVERLVRLFERERPERDKDDFVFQNPFRGNGRDPFSYSSFWKAWDDTIAGLKGKLVGSWHSDRNYTLYSMRTTWIENQLLQGKDIWLVAKTAGHSVRTLMKHYERVDVRLRSGEIAEFQRGSQRPPQRRSV